MRATSALLSVLSIVQPFSRALLDDLGASKADRATVESFFEVTYNHNGSKIRPK